MMPNPKAAEDFATLVLVTARTLRQLIEEPLTPRRRAAMLTSLNDALAPFDDAAEEPLERHESGGCAPPVYTAPLPPIHDPECARIVAIDARCDCSLSRVNPRDDNCELPKTPEPINAR